jgi:GT2 family glycosyltransferase
VTLWLALIDLPEAYRRVSVLRRASDYANWYSKNETIDAATRAVVSCDIAHFSAKPRFKILILATGDGREPLASTLRSLDQQLYREFECIVFDEVPLAVSEAQSKWLSSVPRNAWLDWLNGANSAFTMDEGDDWLVAMRAGERLPIHALYWFASEILRQPLASALYCDDDVLDEANEHHSARFKPDWSLTYFRSSNFVGNALAIRGRAVAVAGGLDVACVRYGFFDLLLRVLDASGNNRAVVHVPAVLFHRSSEHQAESEQNAWEVDAVERHLRRCGVGADVLAWSSVRRIRFELPNEPPLVTIVIPTRDGLHLIRQCVEILLAKTTYSRYEILVVDNQSGDPEVLAYLASLDGRVAGQVLVRVLRYDRPFNYSAINNFAVEEADGELLCLLNNDTEVIAPDWLDEMVGHALQSGVGAVGAKLYYPDGRVQHAGDVVGPGGCANHLHSMIAHDDPGYCNRAVVAQELSAVTAACLLTWKSVYQAVGGLDARLLPVAFNDVDYCLRLRSAGYKVVWTPYAELYHHESVSRGKDRGWRQILRAESEVFVMRRRWKRVMLNDPFYNPNLSYVRPDFSMGHFRQVQRPWERQDRKRQASENY